MKLPFGWITRRAAVELARRAYNTGFDTGICVGRQEAQQMILDAFWKRAGIKRPGAAEKPAADVLRLPSGKVN